MRKIYWFSIAMFIGLFLACNKEQQTIEGNISIEFFSPSPVPVDLNSYKPAVKGKITSDVPLISFSAFLLNNGTEVKVKEKAINNLMEYEFEIVPNYLVSSTSLKIVAVNNLNQRKEASINLDVMQADPANPVSIGNIDAFPDAEGHGRYTTGGRGGKILFVDNLLDDGKQGCLRWAINQEGARTIVFRVSGNINLSSPLLITSDNLTIAGQSAPGDGICIAKNYVQLKEGLQNIIIRYLRFRCAYGLGEYDAMWGRNCRNIIIDHCSFSWGNDEVASFYDNTNFTMQWCIISESFFHSTHPKGNHGFGGIWGGTPATFHHNLIAHHTSRNPRFCGARYHIDTKETEIVDFRNNVIYNWGANSSYGGEYGQQNMVNNYFKFGPATFSSLKNRIIDIWDEDTNVVTPIRSRWYIEGNYVYGFPAITNDNWAGGVQGQWTDPTTRVYTPFPTEFINTQMAVEAFESVLNHAGASMVRDPIDLRIVGEVRNGTATYGGTYGARLGIIDSEFAVGGFPALSTYGQSKDYDNDGMPDEWEIQNGLDPKNYNDHKDYTLNQNYTNIEVYLNGMVK